jgi:hypothetical protein
MRSFLYNENGIDYQAVECIGPLEYVDARCIIYDNGGKGIIFYMENDMYWYSNTTPIAIKINLKRQEYYFNSKLHRDSGPAVITFTNRNNDIRSQFWLKGIQYSYEKFQIKLRKEKIKKLNSLSEKIK